MKVAAKLTCACGNSVVFNGSTFEGVRQEIWESCWMEDVEKWKENRDRSKCDWCPNCTNNEEDPDNPGKRINWDA